MFIDINDKPINKFSIQSFHTKDNIEDGVTSYDIVYILINGIFIIESFTSESDREDKIDLLLADNVLQTD